MKEKTQDTAVAQQSNPPQHDKSVGKSVAKHLEFSNTESPLSHLIALGQLQ